MEIKPADADEDEGVGAAPDNDEGAGAPLDILSQDMLGWAEH